MIKRRRERCSVPDPGCVLFFMFDSDPQHWKNEPILIGKIEKKRNTKRYSDNIFYITGTERGPDGEDEPVPGHARVEEAYHWRISR